MSNDTHNSPDGHGASHPRMYVDSNIRVNEFWPKTLPSATKFIHLHLVELLDDWMIHPDFSGDTARISYALERSGRTVFEFTNWFDLNDFVSFFELHDFILSNRTKVRPTGDSANMPIAVELRNRFSDRASNEFMNTLNLAMDRLTTIHQERVRAASHDAGKVGYFSIDHFNVRERAQLRNIDCARKTLGASSQNILHYVPPQP